MCSLESAWQYDSKLDSICTENLKRLSQSYPDTQIVLVRGTEIDRVKAATSQTLAKPVS